MARPADRHPLNGGQVAAPFDIIRAAHAELLVAELERSRAFYVDQLGMVVTEEDKNAIYLRGYEDRHHHCLALRRAPVAAVGHLAFLVASDRDLKRAAAYYQALGRPVRWIEDGEEAGQGRAIRTQDPVGFPLEFYSRMAKADCLLQRYDLHRGARIQRIDHFNLHVPDVQVAFNAWFELGFRCTEYIAGEEPDETLYAAWLHRKPSVHDIALTAGAGPRVHHVAFWQADTNSIIQICDQLGGSGWHQAIERGPGRHGVSNAFYLYLRDPDGHRIELYTSDYWTGDPDLEPIRWSVRNSQRRSFWGHEVPEAWYRESSLVIGLDGELVAPVEPSTEETQLQVVPQ